MEIVAVDIGGTHARFAIAELDQNKVLLGRARVLRTSDYSSLPEAWRAFGEGLGRALPSAASVAIAGPVSAASVKLTNNAWVLRPTALANELGIDQAMIINDFAATAHAVSVCDEASLKHLCGPDLPLPESGVISVIGPGTGLGVAMLVRDGASGRVIATEGGHVSFAPVGKEDDRILAHLRTRFERVSLERALGGAGLAEIYAALHGKRPDLDDRQLWEQALSRRDGMAAKALDRYCEILGAAAGDFALAHGATAVVIAGGLGLRLAERLPSSGFARSFWNKGRLRDVVAGLPVKIITYPEPGLLGAAAAFRDEKKKAPLQG